MTQAAMIAEALPTQAPPTRPAPIEPTATPRLEPTPVPATPAGDLEALIKSAKILVYENTDARGAGMWIQDALEGMDLKYTQTGSYSGHFMEYPIYAEEPFCGWSLMEVPSEESLDKRLSACA